MSCGAAQIGESREVGRAHAVWHSVGRSRVSGYLGQLTPGAAGQPGRCFAARLPPGKHVCPARGAAIRALEFGRQVLGALAALVRASVTDLAASLTGETSRSRAYAPQCRSRQRTAPKCARLARYDGAASGGASAAFPGEVNSRAVDAAAASRRMLRSAASVPSRLGR